ELDTAPGFSGPRSRAARRQPDKSELIQSCPPSKPTSYASLLMRRLGFKAELGFVFDRLGAYRHHALHATGIMLRKSADVFVRSRIAWRRECHAVRFSGP